VVDDAAQATDGTLIVRTHGVPPDVVEGARARDLTLVDATCPFVAVAQRKAASLRESGYAGVILGERDHPEVVGLEGFAGDGAVVVEDAAGLPLTQLSGMRVGVVVQTTQTQHNLASVAAALAPVARELLVFNTICDATEKRQSAACELAAEVDVVVVVGGRNSANTARLAQLCRAIENRTHHIESAVELTPGWFVGARRIGVTAGASTPDEEIEATVAALRALREG
jgi:4-hydroxy-3-methylbut-2-enyl diphosphate reductase